MNTFYIQTESLSHVGVLRRSGRYPWGSGKRPFQSGGGPKVSKKEKKKAEEIQKERENHEEEKKRALKEGRAADVLKFKSELSTQQLEDALARIKVTSELNSYAKKDMKTFMDVLSEVSKDTKTITNVIKNGSELYNTMAKIYNSTEEGKKKPLTLIAGGGDGEQKKDKK